MSDSVFESIIIYLCDPVLFSRVFKTVSLRTGRDLFLDYKIQLDFPPNGEYITYLIGFLRYLLHTGSSRITC